MRYRIERTLDYFEKGDDELAGQLPLEGVELGFLQDLFGIPNDDPMYEVFPIGPDQAEALRPFISGDLDLSRFDYYLDCAGVPVQEDDPSPDVPTEDRAVSTER